MIAIDSNDIERVMVRGEELGLYGSRNFGTMVCKKDSKPSMECLARHYAMTHIVKDSGRRRRGFIHYIDRHHCLQPPIAHIHNICHSLNHPFSILWLSHVWCLHAAASPKASRGGEGGGG